MRVRLQVKLKPNNYTEWNGRKSVLEWRLKRQRITSIWEMQGHLKEVEVDNVKEHISVFGMLYFPIG